MFGTQFAQRISGERERERERERRLSTKATAIEFEDA
jgi:hypothetical protein